MKLIHVIDKYNHNASPLLVVTPAVAQYKIYV